MATVNNTGSPTPCVLDEAKAIVGIGGDRNKAYGNIYESHRAIADCWTAYLHRTGGLALDLQIEPYQVADMMVLLKVMRNGNKPARDNLVDYAGYAQCAAVICDFDVHPTSTT